MQGRTLLEREFILDESTRRPNDSYTLDITFLNAAIYFVQLETSKGTFTKKIIKE